VYYFFCSYLIQKKLNGAFAKQIKNLIVKKINRILIGIALCLCLSNSLLISCESDSKDEIEVVTEEPEIVPEEKELVTVSVDEDIQTALDKVSTDGGGIVQLTAGVHNITTPLEINSNVTLQGEGKLASTIKTENDINMIIQAAEGMKNVTIKNLILIGSQTKHAGGIQIVSMHTDNDSINIIGVNVFETGWGVHIKGAKNLIIDSCNFSRNGNPESVGYAHNLYLRRVYTAHVTNSIFDNSISANGINISYSRDINIINCEAIGNKFRGMRAADTDGFLVRNCTIANNEDVGLYANTEKVVTKNIYWDSNDVYNNGKDGISARKGATGDCMNCNSYGNATDYNLPSTVTQSGNISDSSKSKVKK